MSNDMTYSSNNVLLQHQVIDWLRFVLISLIIMVHVDGNQIYDGFSGVWVGGVFDAFHVLFAQGICRFTVPCYFLISGFLYFSKLDKWDNKIYFSKEKKRLRTLLIPYILWNAIAVALFVAVKLLKARSGAESFSFSSFWGSQGGLRLFWDCHRAVDTGTVNILGVKIHNGLPFNGPMWFIRDLIIMTLLSPVIFWFIAHFGKAFVIAVCGLMVFDIWLPFEGASSLAFAFFTIGAYLRIKGRDLVSFSRSIERLSYSAAALFLAGTFFLCGIHPVLYNICQRIFALFGCAAAINIVSRMLENGKIHVNETLTKSSFVVFAGHRLYVIPFSVWLVKKVMPFDNAFGHIAQYLVSCTLVIVICVAAYIFLKKLMPRTLAILTGGR